jgi:lactoylglutathione lyase
VSAEASDPIVAGDGGGRALSAGAVHHLALNVANLERSLEFYAGALGMRATLRMEIGGEPFERLLRLAPGTVGRVAYVQGPQRLGQIELIEWTPPAPGEASSGATSFTTRGLRLPSFSVQEPLAEWHARLVQAGVTCWSEPVRLVLPNYGPIDAFIAEDPDGNLIELVRLPSDEEVREFRRGGGGGAGG